MTPTSRLKLPSAFTLSNLANSHARILAHKQLLRSFRNSLAMLPLTRTGWCLVRLLNLPGARRHFAGLGWAYAPR